MKSHDGIAGGCFVVGVFLIGGILVVSTRLSPRVLAGAQWLVAGALLGIALFRLWRHYSASGPSRTR